MLDKLAAQCRTWPASAAGSAARKAHPVGENILGLWWQTDDNRAGRGASLPVTGLSLQRHLLTSRKIKSFLVIFQHVPWGRSRLEKVVHDKKKNKIIRTMFQPECLHMATRSEVQDRPLAAERNKCAAEFTSWEWFCQWSLSTRVIQGLSRTKLAACLSLAMLQSRSSRDPSACSDGSGAAL